MKKILEGNQRKETTYIEGGKKEIKRHLERNYSN